MQLLSIYTKFAVRSRFDTMFHLIRIRYKTYSIFAQKYALGTFRTIRSLLIRTTSDKNHIKRSPECISWEVNNNPNDVMHRFFKSPPSTKRLLVGKQKQRTSRHNCANPKNQRIRADALRMFLFRFDIDVAVLWFYCCLFSVQTSIFLFKYKLDRKKTQQYAHNNCRNCLSFWSEKRPFMVEWDVAQPAFCFPCRKRLCVCARVDFLFRQPLWPGNGSRLR